MNDDQLFEVEDVDPARLVNRFTEPDLDKGEAAKRLRSKQLHELYRSEASESSVEAARKVLPKISKLEQVVLDVLAEHPEGLTIDQMVELSGKPYNSISPRPSKLVAKGVIYVAGEGKSAMGNKAHIYKVVGK